MNSCNFQIDLQCPQCGAPVVLEEAEYIIQCRFCRTRNIIHTHPYPCYYIEPGQKYANLPVVYVPYWRFKGIEFSLGRKKPDFRIIDHSYLAVDKTGLPVSLGLRSQTQKLRFIQKGIQGSFLPPSLSRKDMLTLIAGNTDKKVHIGEILSLIFMPFYQDTDIIYDGLSGKKVAINTSSLSADKKSPAFLLEFTPSLCPDCGWDMTGETDSLVMQCGNCMSFWLIHNKKLNRLKALIFDEKSDTDIQIPFWRLQITFQSIDCYSYAHLIKIANLPTVVRKEHEKQTLYFYIPAFKINPKLFLRIGRQTTLAQIQPTEVRNMPKHGFHPTNLPLEEGFQAIRPLLMDLCSNKNDFWDLLENEKLQLKTFSLLYVPFRTSGSEYIQDTLGVSLQKNSLRFGRQL